MSEYDNPERQKSEESGQIRPDERLGPYRILGTLGAGGMGTVFKAQDVRLNRFVALKFLKAERLTPDMKRRFHQEAITASALNHPGIIQIYDIGEWQGADYIAMEYVEGATLQQILHERRLPVAESMRYATQIADAVAAAHGAGIIHRDLKPGNIMLTAAGSIKVLDFGLAKLHPLAAPTSSHTEPEATQTLAEAVSGHTKEGVILGSPPYMSPEQARGKPLDARSDIFSFGLILYEMLAGRPAFLGTTTLEVLSEILHVEARPPRSINPAIPNELNVLIVRCLRKDPGQRFQSMREVKLVLEGVQSQLAAAPANRRIRWLTAAGIALALTSLAVIGLFVLPGRKPAQELGAGAIARLTSDGGVSLDPAISPDGKLVAYASDRSGEGNLDIWVKPVDGGDPIRLTRDPADDQEPNFSPDGSQIVFRSSRDGGGIYMAPAGGGEARRIAVGGRRPRFSPDGKKVAYWVGGAGAEGEGASANPFPLRAGNGKVFVLDLAAFTTTQIGVDFAAAVHPVWSPDGKSLLFVGWKDAKNPNTYDWWIAPLNGGQPDICKAVLPYEVLDPFAWRGNRVYFEWRGGNLGLRTIGQVTLDAKARRLTGTPGPVAAGATEEFSPSVAANGRLVFAGMTASTNLYSVPFDPNRARPTGGLERLTRGVNVNRVRAVSSDGKRVVFLSNRTGVYQVWSKDLETGQEQALTGGERLKTILAASPDGRQIAWTETNFKIFNIYLTPFSGGSRVKICGDCQGTPWVWSPDGRFLLYGRNSISLLELATRKKTPYLANSRLDLRARSISADGKWLAFTAHRSTTDFTIQVAPFDPLRAPAESEWVEVLSSQDAHANPTWSPDGSLLYFSSERDGHNCLWAQRVDPATKTARGKPFAVLHYHLPSLSLVAPLFDAPLALASDKLVISAQERSGEIWTWKQQ